MGKIKKIWQDRGNQYRYAQWLWQYSRPYLGKILLVMVFGLLETVASLLMVQISKEIIDHATFGNAFVRLMVVYVLLMLGMQAVTVISSLVSTMLTERFSFGIRKQIYEKIIHSHWMDVKKYHTGDLMTRLTSDAGNVADGIIGTIPSIIQLAVELLLVFFTLFYYSPMLAMFALLAGGTWQIFTRWILRNPSTVTDEFLRYVLIWASMIGSAYCFYKDKHLALDLVKGRAKGAFNVVLSVFIEAAIVFFVGYVFVYGGWKLTANATNVSSVMRIPFKFLYSILPISGVFIILARALKYVQLFAERKEKKGENA